MWNWSSRAISTFGTMCSKVVCCSRDLNYHVIRGSPDAEALKCTHMREKVKYHRNRTVGLHFLYFIRSYTYVLSIGSRAPVTQSAATRAVNLGVVSSNPSSPNILSEVWQKSLWQASFVFHQWSNSLCGKAASCLESMLCGGLVWANQEKIRIGELAAVIWL